MIKYSSEQTYTYTKSEANKKEIAFFKMAEIQASLSKDQNTKVGAIIVDKEGKVVSTGYNGCASKFGVVRGSSDHIVPHTREEVELTLHGKYKFVVDDLKFKTNKYPFMLHAEQNALLTCSDNNRLKGATIYTTHYTCNVCANMIAQSGIKHVNVLDNKHGTFEETIKPVLFTYHNMGINLSIFK